MPGWLRRLYGGMQCGVRVLGAISLALGLITAGALSLAIATDYWLYTSEPISYSDMLPDDNSSMYMMETDYRIYMHSGLWRTCIYYPDFPEMPSNCYSIEYETAGTGRISDTDTSNSILRAIRKSSSVLVVSLLVLAAALGFATTGNTKGDAKTVIGAVLYITTALFLAVGVIFYISAVNDEVSHRKKSDNKDEKFEYNYGWAFSFAGFCFISCMVVAVTNISLYLKRYPNLEDMVAIIPGLEKHSGLEIRSSSDDQLEHSAMTDPSTSCHNPTIIL